METGATRGCPAAFSVGTPVRRQVAIFAAGLSANMACHSREVITVRKTAALAVALACAFAGGAFGQERRYEVTVAPSASPRGFEKVKVSKATVGAAPIRLWYNTAIDPDCSPAAPGATLTILTPPSHGAVTISDDPFYAAFPQANPRSACNDRKVPGHQAFYTAAAGFTGHDQLVLQGTSPEGRVRQISVDIDVRR